MYVIAFDFETAGGCIQKNGFVRLGAVAFDVKNGTVLTEFDGWTSMEGYEWEERCLNEFWKKKENESMYEEALKMTEKSVYTPYQVVDNFVHWVKIIAATVGHDDIILISDNVAFDGALLRAFASIDIMYIFGSYRDMVDVSNVYYGISRKMVGTKLLDTSSFGGALQSLGISEQPTFDVVHDHNPVNYATLIAKKWAYVMKLL